MRTLLTLTLLALIAAPAVLIGCDRTESKSTTVKTRTTDTPDGVKTTTEKVERKVETDRN
ncbi:MAG TPA: hypothetical protein VD997_07920 [Phycisphaerales bacterium]|nr:hypothetical protein [Phycisphaerales bacterium]